MVFAVGAAVLCRQAMVLWRALVYGLLLPMMVGLLLSLTMVVTALFSPEKGQSLSYGGLMAVFMVMATFIGFLPALLTVLVSDVLWLRKGVRYWFVPVLAGALFAFLYTYFAMNEDRLATDLLFASMGAVGGVMFVALRWRLLPLNE